MKSNPRFTAKYAPGDPSELTAEAEEWVGWEGEWEVTHLESETGMPLCTVSRELREGGSGYPPVEAFLWVPINDLASIRWSDETEGEAAEERAALMGERYGPGRTPLPPSG
jgi:hypothetical protein